MHVTKTCCAVIPDDKGWEIPCFCKCHSVQMKQFIAFDGSHRVLVTLEGRCMEAIKRKSNDYSDLVDILVKERNNK